MTDKNIGWEKISDQLESIIRLIILSLLRSGVTQSEIANALDVSQPTISRMFPKGIIKVERKD